jgi:hypothetical protein
MHLLTQAYSRTPESATSLDDPAGLVPRVEGIVSVGEFYEIAGGGQIIFT